MDLNGSRCKNSHKKGLKAQFFRPPSQSDIKIQADADAAEKVSASKIPKERGPCTLMPSQKDRLQTIQIQRQRRCLTQKDEL